MLLCCKCYYAGTVISLWFFYNFILLILLILLCWYCDLTFWFDFFFFDLTYTLGTVILPSCSCDCTLSDLSLLVLWFYSELYFFDLTLCTVIIQHMWSYCYWSCDLTLTLFLFSSLPCCYSYRCDLTLCDLTLLVLWSYSLCDLTLLVLWSYSFCDLTLLVLWSCK